MYTRWRYVFSNIYQLGLRIEAHHDFPLEYLWFGKDPMQLPPTVLSQTASQAGYDQSLFVRMQRNAPDVAHLLRYEKKRDLFCKINSNL
jgi:hypothetical protein